jgi:large subunit ribosomal protein L3
MIKGLLGRKIGMTQIFSPTGEVIPVTIIQAGPCIVTQIRTLDRDGYEAVQIGFEEVHERKLTLPEKGHLARAYEVAHKQELDAVMQGHVLQEGKRVRHIQEFPADNLNDHAVGDIIGVNIFQGIQHIDVSGLSKGRGFAGVVKRHGFRGGPRTHGQSDRLRAPGSIGGGTTPGRVWKGQRMAGRMGNKRVTVQSLELVEIIPEKHLLLVRGATPGPRSGLLQIKPAVKIYG